MEISGVPLANFGGEDFGRIDLTDALTNSVNTVWAQVGEKLGKCDDGRYMKRFGFYRKPPTRPIRPTSARRAGLLQAAARLLPPTAD